VRLGVTSGKLAVGDQLPSVRALAESLVVNPNTVARAYGDLMREGLLESRAGRGVFITAKRKVFSRAEGWRRLEPLLHALIGEAMTLDFTPEELRAEFEEKLGKWKHPKGGDKK
jgi:GntR family transcriptional regulator